MARKLSQRTLFLRNYLLNCPKGVTLGEVQIEVEKLCGKSITYIPACLPSFVTGFVILTALGYVIFYDPTYKGVAWVVLIFHEFGHILEGDVCAKIQDPDEILTFVRNAKTIDELEGIICTRSVEPQLCRHTLSARQTWEKTLEELAEDIVDVYVSPQERFYESSM